MTGRQGAGRPRSARARWTIGLAAAFVLAATGTAAASLVSTHVPDSGPLQFQIDISSKTLEPIAHGDFQLLDGTGGSTAALDFRFYTRLRTADGGEIVRSHVAVANVPTLLNVDMDVAPDVVATLGVLSLNEFSLRIDRALTEVGQLPLAVEAIVDDPTNGSLPREHINFGYDARASSAPVRWGSSIVLQAAAQDTDVMTIAMRQDVATAGTSLKLVGGLFDGEPGERRDPMGGRLDYAPVPTTSTVDLTVGKKLGLGLGANLPVEVTGEAELVDGGQEHFARAVITGLPEDLQLDYERTGAEQRKATYTATGEVTKVDLTYRTRTNGVDGDRIVVDAQQLPTGMTIQQTAARAAEFTATGGKVGSVEVGFANGEPRLLEDADKPYAYMVEEGSLKSYAGRIDDLRWAKVNATDAIVVDVELDERNPFVAKLRQPGRSIDGTLLDLPKKAHVDIDLANHEIVYDGFGDTIDAIDVDATQDAPFFDAVKRIDGRVEGLPASVTIGLKPSSGEGAGFTATSAIGKIEALLTSGPEATLPAEERGMVVEDFADRFVAFGRVTGLREVTVKDTGKIQVIGKLDSQPLHAIFRKEGLSVDARTSAVPDSIDVTFDAAGGSVVYDGSAGLTSLDATVLADAPLFGRVKRIAAHVADIPADITIGFKPQGGSGGSFTAEPESVGLIEAELTDGSDPDLPALLPGGRSGVVLEDVPARFSVAGRIKEVKKASVTLSDANLSAGIDTDPLPGDVAQPFDLTVTTNKPDDAIDADAVITGKISALPGSMSLVQQGTEMTYTASKRIDEVTLDAFNLPGEALVGKPHEVRATIKGVPAGFKIVSGGADTGVVATVDDAFTRVDAEIWDHGPAFGHFPEDGRNKATLWTRDGRLHAKLRVFNLAKAVLGESPLGGQLIDTGWAGQPAGLDLLLLAGTTQHKSEVRVKGEELPSQAKVLFRNTIKDQPDQSDGTRISFWGSEATADVHAGVSSGAVSAELDLTDVPRETHFCVGADSQCDAQAPQHVLVDDELVEFRNDTAITTFANGIVSLTGTVCLPPADDDGPIGVPAPFKCGRTARNRIEIDNARLQRTRLELATGDSDTKDEDDEPVADGLLKLWLDTDDEGLRVDTVKLVNTDKDSETKIHNPGDPPLRNLPGGMPFYITLDLDTPPSVEEWNNRQLDCRGTSLIIQALGTTWDAMKIVKTAQAVKLLPEICKF